VEEEEEKKGK